MSTEITSKWEGRTVYAILDGDKVGQISVPDIDFHWADGTFVKMAGISGVETEERLRGKGIASKLMAESVNFAIENGYSCSGVSTTVENVARRLYARSGYITLFKPGRFEKHLQQRDVPEVPGVKIRPYQQGDEKALMELFEEVYDGFFGWRKKESDRWFSLRKKLMDKEGDIIFIAENDNSIVGWSGCFEQWVGLVSELYVRPCENRTEIARALQIRLENHHIAQGRDEAHFWLSIADDFSAYLLLGDGYRFREMRVFMVNILDLSKLLGQMTALFEQRLKGKSDFKGLISIETPTQKGLLRIDEKVSVEKQGQPDAILSLSQEVLTRVVAGVPGFWDAYLQGMLSVKPRMTEQVRDVFDLLFPDVPWHHPADDMW